MNFVNSIYGSALALKRDLVSQVSTKLLGKWTPEELDAFCVFPSGTLRSFQEDPTGLTGRHLSCLKQPIAVAEQEFEWMSVDKFLENTENLQTSFSVFLSFTTSWQETDLVEKKEEVRKAVAAYIVVQCEKALDS